MAAELPFSFTWWKVWFVRKILKRCSFFVVASYAAHNTEVDNDDDNYDDNFFLNTNRPQRDVLKEWHACICIWWATKNRQRIRKVSERLAVNKLAGSSKWIDTYVVYIKIVESVIVVAAERDQCVAWLFDFCFLFFLIIIIMILNLVERSWWLRWMCACRRSHSAYTFVTRSILVVSSLILIFNEFYAYRFVS